jgi:hypothetical protein
MIQVQGVSEDSPVTAATCTVPALHRAGQAQVVPVRLHICMLSCARLKLRKHCMGLRGPLLGASGQVQLEFSQTTAGRPCVLTSSLPTHSHKLM